MTESQLPFVPPQLIFLHVTCTASDYRIGQFSSMFVRSLLACVYAVDGLFSSAERLVPEAALAARSLALGWSDGLATSTRRRRHYLAFARIV